MPFNVIGNVAVRVRDFKAIAVQFSNWKAPRAIFLILLYPGNTMSWCLMRVCPAGSRVIIVIKLRTGSSLLTCIIIQECGRKVLFYDTISRRLVFFSRISDESSDHVPDGSDVSAHNNTAKRSTCLHLRCAVITLATYRTTVVFTHCLVEQLATQWYHPRRILQEFYSFGTFIPLNGAPSACGITRHSQIKEKVK